MFWNNGHCFQTAKARLALLYGCLFLLAFAMVFIPIYAFWGVEHRDLLDRELEERNDRAAFVYWTGTPPPEEFQSFHLTSDRVRRAKRHILRLLPGFRPLLAFTREDGGRLELLGMEQEQLHRVSGDWDAPVPSVQMELFARPEHSELAIAELRERGSGEGRRRSYCLLLDRRNEFVFDPFLPPGEREAFQRFPHSGKPGKIHFGVVHAPRHRVRIAWRKLDDDKTLITGVNLHDLDVMQRRASVIFLTAGGSVLVLSVLAGWLLAHWMFGEVEKVSQAAEEIASGDYSRRVPPGRSGSELRRLTDSFNTMVGNTEAAMTELRTISDNIAHDLRTPLTRMLGRAELTVTGPQTLDAYRNTMGDNAEECRRMLSLINLMLEIARTESGAAKLNLAPLDLKTLAEQALTLFAMVTGRKAQKLEFQLPPEPLILKGDKLKLQQVFANLLDNAAKFTPEHGVIKVTLTATAEYAVFTVRDSGCGVAPEDREKVFKRFYRADSSRNLPGNGLGLSLVQAVVHAHGGTVTLRSEPGSGAEFTVTLPRQ